MLITDKPEDLPSGNALDDVDDPDDTDEYGLSIDRYLAFGTTPKAIPRPPHDGEVVTYTVKVECVGQAHKRRADGEMRYKSELTILSVARVGEDLPPDYVPPPSAAQVAKEKKAAEAAEKAKRQAELDAETEENQPPMFGDNGEIPDEDPDAIEGEREPAPGDEDDEDDAPPIDRPAFSDVNA